jgi:methionine-S-sulfoxide reductase
MENATFGGGCFWCTEAIFQQIKGVISVKSGYSGGDDPQPTYSSVCSGSTGHAEVVQIEFNPADISFSDLLGIHFTTHDPTTINSQGADVGTQYRSIILAHSDNQYELAQSVKKEMQNVYDRAIVTEIDYFKAFYPAEAYHQNYFRDNPSAGYCLAIISPKVQQFKARYQHLIKKD